MTKIGIVVHGGAGPDSEFIRTHYKDYKKGLEDAIAAGYAVLKENGKAIDAVEAAVNALENNPLFNSGRGSALNAKGEIEMDASIMDGGTLNCGAVGIVKNVRNPISLAKAILSNTNFIYLGAGGALDYAKTTNLAIEPDSYFVTEHQFNEYDKKRKEAYAERKEIQNKSEAMHMHGTVGAVAVDFEGNVAAGTSTGGTCFCKEGRISDSSIIGVGTYANNSTCAVSCTGDGEYVMRGVIASSVSNLIKYKNKNLKQACKEIVHEENKSIKGDLGIIAIDPKGTICCEFNSERMHRGWKTGNNKLIVKIYQD